ncbi:MAG: hypothetical protein RI554_10760, partial [Trueperaceae bacterium]|nr:hypothetical protein [Trueperaceae bacterium]
MILRGLDVDGVLDHAADLRNAGAPEVVASRRVLGAVARRPAHVGERWIAGDEARATLTPTDLLDLDDRSFAFVRDAVQRLTAPNDADDAQDAEDAKDGDPADVVGAHLRALGPTGADRTVLVVPDTLDQEVQGRWLRTLRAAAPGTPELLWRPVAAILGWVAGLDAEEAGALDGVEVLHVHLGAYRIERSRLELRVEWSGADPVVVPRRNGPGHVVDAGDVVVRPVTSVLQYDRDAFDLDDASLRALMTQERPWRALFGEMPPAALVPTESGALRRVDGPTGPARVDVDAAIVEVGRTLDASGRHDDPIVLIDGVVGHAVDDAGPIARRLARHVEARVTRSEVLDPSTAAEGAARYAWRLERDLPTYEDVLPSLRIFAKRNGEPAWVDLVPEGMVVPGGKEYAPDPLKGFRVAPATEELNYAIARGDAKHVRLTRTQLPTPPEKTVDVDLVVRQRPGQGFASVQVKAPPGHGTFEAGVYLDWATMERTRETPDSYLEAKRAEAPLRYPAAAPHRSDAGLWRTRGVKTAINRVLYADPHDPETPGHLTRLRELLQRKSASTDPTSPRMVDAHGHVPTGVTLGRKPVGEVYDALRAKVAEIATEARSGRSTVQRSTDAFRAAALVGSYTFAGAPEAVTDFARAVLGRSRTLASVERRNAQYAWNVAGRSFERPEDLRVLFGAAVHAYREHENLKDYQMRAVQEAFLYRETAYQALDSETAHALAHAAVEMLRGEVKSGKLANRFGNASKLLLGVLRYRIADPTFLAEDLAAPSPAATPPAADPDRPTRVRVPGPATSPKRKTLLREALAILDEARTIAKRKKKRDVAFLAEALTQYLEGRG